MMGNFDWGQAADFLNVIGGIGGLVAIIVVFWLRGTFVSRADYEADKKEAAATAGVAIGAVQGRLNLIESALVEIKAGLKSLPEIQELHRLAMSLERLTGTVSALDTKLNGFGDLMDRLATMVDRHEEHLLENPRK